MSAVPAPSKPFFRRVGDHNNGHCLGKYCWQTPRWDDYICALAFDLTAVCDHTFQDSEAGCADWKARFEIRRVGIEVMGHGLYSKTAWTNGDMMGLYLGELLPTRTENTDYVHEVSIGPNFSRAKPTLAYVDAFEVGSYVRFASHSCKANAEIVEARVGTERVLARRDIAADEQVCIDYWEDYFNGRVCYCGSVKRKYSASEATGKGRGKKMA
jgi:hypothetical protein